MALVDDPLVQLVAQIAYGRESDFLKRVLGEERRECANQKHDEKRGQDFAPLLGGTAIPPVTEPLLRAVEVIDQPAALPFRLVAVEHRRQDRVLDLVFARLVRSLA